MKLLPFFLMLSMFLNLSAQNFQGAGIDSRGTEAQVRDLANQARFNNKQSGARYDTLFRDFEKVFYVSKSEMKDKNKLDSLFNLSKYYLVDAIRNGYHRIIITVIKKGLFAKYREQIFYCDKLYEELTGRKLYSQ